ncbi:MAG TPA: phospholipid carrier-dependent glycosyltransferase [Bryobacteraceae bacterium]|jgi:4-amino-4-deoxy-L-arabinose transferase-like glycosyltransferase|nr:phospholipid carrier-dependent glycosyltransferase [Bryobacteraceae bacterium]
MPLQERFASRRVGLVCLWALFMARGLFYISFVPMWEGFDEWSHYAVLQNIAVGGRFLPRVDDKVSLEVQASLALAPMPGRSLGTRHDIYWQLPEQERRKREQELRSLPAAWARIPAGDGERAYQGQQAPLYFWMLAPFYRLAEGLPLPSRVWFLRLFSLLLASIAIPLSYLAALKFFRERSMAFGSAALIVASPALMMTVGHIGNDSLAVLAGALLLLTLFSWKQSPQSTWHATALGLALALALLTKAYFLALIPPLIGVAALQVVRRPAHGQTLAVFALPLVFAAWWYARNWSLTHSLSGEQIELAARGATQISLAESARGMNWIQAADFTFLTHIWLGNWSFLVLRSWMYRFFGLAAIGAAVGLVLRMLRRPNSDLWTLIAFYASFLIALAYHAIRTFQVEGFPGALGSYLFAIAGIETLLVVSGLEFLTPDRWKPGIAPVGILCFAALECFGLLFYSIPYYTGFIARLPNGGLPALQIGQLREGGLQTMLGRLAVNKPDFLHGAAMPALFALFLAATLVLAGAVLLFGRRNER